MVAGSVAVQKDQGGSASRRAEAPPGGSFTMCWVPRECKQRFAASFSFFQFSRIMLMSVYSFCNRKTKFKLQN